MAQHAPALSRGALAQLETRRVRALTRLMLALFALVTACGDAESATEAGTDRVEIDVATETSTPASAPDTNTSPIIETLAIAPEPLRAGDSARLEVEATDPDGDALRTEISWSLDFGEPLATGRTFRVPARSRNSRVTASVTLRDTRGGTTTDSVSTSVENTPPTIDTVRLLPETLTVVNPIQARIVTNDVDGDPLESRVTWWVNEIRAGGASHTLDPSEFKRGDTIVAEVVTHDGTDGSAAVRSAAVVVGNAAPRITSKPGVFDAQGSIAKKLEAVDPDGDRRLRFTLRNAPEGMRLDPVTGEIAWSPSPLQRGTHAVEVEVRDDLGATSSQAFELTVGSAPPAASP